MQLPLDVILEMFSHLHPRALLSIARTSKALRAMVFSQRHADLWKNAREEAGVPGPPGGFSEPRWAALLFDINCCQVCWNKINAEVNWYFLRRACDECTQRHTVRLPYPNHSMGYSEWLPRQLMLELVDSEVMEYIPWGRSGYQTNAQAVLFWDDDAIDVVSAWQELSKHTEPAGRKAFHSWKMHRREIIQKNLNLIPTYQLWRINCLYPSKKLIKHRENRLVGEQKYMAFQEIKNRLREAGHRTEDIEMSKLLYPAPYLLDSDAALGEEWERVRPSFEGDIGRLKDFRVTLEMELVTQERFSVFEEVYETFLNTLPPSERYRCPEISSFRTDRDVVTILETNKNIPVTRAHFQPIANKMRAIVDRAHNELRRSLVSTARPHFGLHEDEPWLLARCVFTRFRRADPGLLMAGDGVLVGWDMITTHRHKGHSTVWLRPRVPVHASRAFDYNHSSSVDSRRLVALANLPQNVTVTELDERDPRFAWEHEGGPYVLTVFTWRAMLAHLYVNRIHATQYRPRLATEEEKSAAKAFEVTARQQAKAWACNHCPQYLQASDADTKPVVLAHLAEKHGVTEPEMPTDYFINERCRYAYEVPYYRN
ncbi:hypothetical protein FA13DRAFT_1164829 [Coprinellus micaceus]|uniref:F-box domain-containing protein n=1 Tax=Coprinellus micaceus TaxID=71717 RepID=A0A4Y7RBL6_COPMI|nr:hypothetical protein FA13DRAFT_1164829 [Coprinellus micaceus]